MDKLCFENGNVIYIVPTQDKPVKVVHELTEQKKEFLKRLFENCNIDCNNQIDGQCPDQCKECGNIE